MNQASGDNFTERQKQSVPLVLAGAVEKSFSFYRIANDKVNVLVSFVQM